MKKEYPKQPIVGVGAIIIHDGKMLIVKRGSDPGKGKWSVPGGLVELGETVKEAVEREVLEECNLKVEASHLIDIVDNIIRDKNGRIKYHFIILDFFAKLRGGKLKPNSEIIEAKWVPIDEVERYDLTNTFREFMKRNLSKLKTQ